MPKTKTDPVDDMRMKESDFNDIMAKALGSEEPNENVSNDEEPKRLSSYPRKKR